MAEKYVRKLTKKGKYSYSIILPREIVDKFNWQDRQKLVVEPYGEKKILISDWPSKK